MPEGSVVVVGGTGGLGKEIASHYLEEGSPVVLTGSTQERAEAVAAELGDGATGIGFDLSDPAAIRPALSGLGPVSYLVLSSIARDNNMVADYSYESALNLTTMKLVGYTETIHALLPQLSDESAVVLFGGRAKDRPYPGSTTVTTVNGGISSLINALVLQLAPIRFNAIHPGIVGDSPFWAAKPEALDAVVARTPTGRLTTMADIVDAVVFLLENRAINGVNLYVDGGWMLM